eukprot:TRINITY_DN7032_c0_g1_i1.p1 TRINITY_DN7032_c0_g1~~TRINITY_DN7032_c0_g1_i1.p1  ORF type:complete len:1069 (-),score=166.20 TRINITY_DN7032_c0_g1_i1:56-3226(-)
MALPPGTVKRPGTPATSGNISVYVRMRPFLPQHDLDGMEPLYLRGPAQSIRLDKERGTVTLPDKQFLETDDRDFTFTGVFPPDTTQQEVFEVVARPSVESCLEGRHGVIFAYGQTGTGKTYTLSNRQPAEEGLTTRCLDHIFNRISLDRENEYTVTVNFVQIYQELVQDLFNPVLVDLPVREDADKGIFLAGVTCRAVRTAQEALRLLDEAAKHRVVAGTQMNAESSRSHTCLIVNIERRQKFRESDYEESESSAPSRSRVVLKGRLTIVDLSGSERLKKSKAEGVRRLETQAINRSLACLGNVVHALTDPKATHIPYRESKLTRLLQDSLGGTSRTSIIVTIGPLISHLCETTSSLLFGQRAMRVVQTDKVHLEMDYKVLALRLQAQLDDAQTRATVLTQELERAEERVHKLEGLLRQGEELSDGLQQLVEEYEQELHQTQDKLAERDRQLAEIRRNSEAQITPEARETADLCKEQLADWVALADDSIRSPPEHRAAPTETTAQFRETVPRLMLTPPFSPGAPTASGSVSNNKKSVATSPFDEPIQSVPEPTTAFSPLRPRRLMEDAEVDYPQSVRTTPANAPALSVFSPATRLGDSYRKLLSGMSPSARRPSLFRPFFLRYTPLLPTIPTPEYTSVPLPRSSLNVPRAPLPTSAAQQMQMIQSLALHLSGCVGDQWGRWRAERSGVAVAAGIADRAYGSTKEISAFLEKMCSLARGTPVQQSTKQGGKPEQAHTNPSPLDELLATFTNTIRADNEPRHIGNSFDSESTKDVPALWKEISHLTSSGPNFDKHEEESYPDSTLWAAVAELVGYAQCGVGSPLGLGTPLRPSESLHSNPALRLVGDLHCLSLHLVLSLINQEVEMDAATRLERVAGRWRALFEWLFAIVAPLSRLMAIYMAEVERLQSQLNARSDALQRAEQKARKLLQICELRESRQLDDAASRYLQLATMQQRYEQQLQRQTEEIEKLEVAQKEQTDSFAAYRIAVERGNASTMAQIGRALISMSHREVQAIFQPIVAHFNPNGTEEARPWRTPTRLRSTSRTQRTPVTAQSNRL